MEIKVWLLIVYSALVIVGDIADYLIGLVMEAYWPAASLPVFLFLYFLFLWVAWIAAVRITKPPVASQGTAP
jgi:hypothetical protein